MYLHDVISVKIRQKKQDENVFVIKIRMRSETNHSEIINHSEITIFSKEKIKIEFEEK